MESQLFTSGGGSVRNKMTAVLCCDVKIAVVGLFELAQQRKRKAHEW